jgi:hypothetical protein
LKWNMNLEIIKFVSLQTASLSEIVLAFVLIKFSENNDLVDGF